MERIAPMQIHPFTICEKCDVKNKQQNEYDFFWK